MKTYKLLALDETGKASYNHKSELFILSGVVISEKSKDKLDHKMRKLKIKYFKDEELVFHSRDMARKKGPFSILQDKKMEINFWSEFTTIVNDPEISMLFVIVNKRKAKNKNWQSKTILKQAYVRILQEFTDCYLKQGFNGKIIVESDPSQDFYLIQSHNHMQGVSPNDYRQKITSLSLVKKSNLDIDIQLSDALAVIAGIKYYHKKVSDSDRVTKMKLRLIERKLNSKTNPSRLISLL